jgi:plasmid rolling circle replication initiator protein Rep
MPDGSTPVGEGILLSLSSISPGDKPWEEHRAIASEVQRLYAESFPDYAERINCCSRHLGFALEAQETGEFKLKLRNALFCRVRHCPVCRWRRRLMWQARFFSALPRIQQAHPTARWLMLCLTQRNVPLEDLRATVKEMNAAWGRLTKRKVFPAIGWTKSLEVTRSDIGEAHPHFHCLLVVPSSYFGGNYYIKQEEWRSLWKEAMRLDYLPEVHITAIKGKKGDSNGTARGILEAIKYTVKEEELVHSAEWLEGLTQQLHKTRAIAVGGILKDFLSEDEPEDLIHAEDEEEPSEADEDNLLWFGWREMLKIYAKE